MKEQSHPSCDCGAAFGSLHEPGCCMEECPFCQGQLITCDCVYEQLDVDPEEESFEDLTNEQEEQWEELLDRKGRVPHGSEKRWSTPKVFPKPSHERFTPELLDRYVGGQILIRKGLDDGFFVCGEVAEFHLDASALIIRFAWIGRRLNFLPGVFRLWTRQWVKDDQLEYAFSLPTGRISDEGDGELYVEMRFFDPAIHDYAILSFFLPTHPKLDRATVQEGSCP